MRRGLGWCVACALLVAGVTGCGSSAKPQTAPASSTFAPTMTPTSTTSSTTTTPTTSTTMPVASPPIVTAPRGRIQPVAPASAYAATVSTVTATDLGASWHTGCPVGPDQLRSVDVAYWGFDGGTHTGTLIVNADVVDAVTHVFRQLYAAHFPIRRIIPVDRYGGDDDASMAADNTSAFNCRFVAGSTNWSAHAYGDAIDVNTIENPYVQAGGLVSPPAGEAYMNRSDIRAGMAYWGGALVDAFAAVGWQWGGRWNDPDYQHFSSTGG